jgi:hypothetical protein
MKTLINVLTFVTAITLVAGVTAAMADPQASDEAAHFASQARAASGPYASARVGGNSTVYVPSTTDFQATGTR